MARLGDGAIFIRVGGKGSRITLAALRSSPNSIPSAFVVIIIVSAAADLNARLGRSSGR